MTRRDQLELGGGTAGGMLIGGLIGGGPGVLIGGAVGATATTVHWLAKHRSATMPAGTQLTLELNRPMAMGAVGGTSAGSYSGARQARAAAASNCLAQPFASPQTGARLLRSFEIALSSLPLTYIQP